MTSIFTGFSKFIYNRLHMGMCASGDTLQGKLDKICGEIEGIKTYISDILFLIKYRLYKHTYQIIFIFSRMRAAVLKVNAPNYSFGLKEIPYV